MNNDDSLDLLDLDDGTSMDTLPDAAPFASPRPKKPWLLLGVGVAVIILATYIIVRTIGGESSSSIEVNLDTPTVVVAGAEGDVAEPTVSPDVKPATDTVEVAPIVPASKPVVQPVNQPIVKDVETTPGVPVRVIEDRKDVKFDPSKAETKASATVKQSTTAAKKTVAKKSVTKTKVAPKGSWYVQFGSYSTRALAESGEKQIRAAHPSLFQGKQFVILAASVKGVTNYRLRIAFNTASDANGFCQNAKSDGLDCYVAK